MRNDNMPEDGAQAYEQLMDIDKPEKVCFDRVSVSLFHIVGKVKQDMQYCKNPEIKAEAEELMNKYNTLAERDKNYRIKEEQATRVRKIATTLEDKKDKERIGKEKVQETWDRYNNLKLEMADYYIESVDINRLAAEFILYNMARSRQESQVQYEDALLKKDKAFETKKKEQKQQLDDDLAGYDKWSSNNIQSWGSRIGAFFGTFGSTYVTINAVKDIEIFGHKLGEIVLIASAAAASFALPAIDYVISKKKAAKQKAHKRDVDKLTDKLQADKAAVGIKLAKDKSDITDDAYNDMRDIYAICFGNLDGFPQNPVEVYAQRAASRGGEDHTPMEAVRAKSTKDIKIDAKNLSKEAEELLE